MLDTQTKKRIDDCRDILVGKLPDPKAQIEQITIGLIYKFMDDMDKEAIELGGSAKFFSGNYEKYAWNNLFDTKVTAAEMLRLYSEAIESMEKNPNIPQLFRNIFNNAYLPYRDPETLKLFLKTIGEFEYTHSEKLGDAFEYLLSVMGSQGDAGQFRTPRHIIDFLVEIVDPGKNDTILDPACGTAGFLISAFKHILKKNKNVLTPDERKKLINNFIGYDISPDMVRLSLVNLYLHGFSDPHIHEYDTLSSEERWNENYDVILANPPFMSPKGGIRPHKKFTVSSNRSEVLFVDYIAEHLNLNGRAGIIVPEGVIFQSGKAYKELRKMLVESSLYAVVSLPAGVFNPYSGVKTSILLMDKSIAKKRNEILFVKIDNDGYNLGAQRTAVKGSQMEEAIALISAFRNSPPELVSGSVDIAHAVLRSTIAENGDYNLSGERYKNQQDLGNLNFPIAEIGELMEFQYGKPLKKEDRHDGQYPVFGSNGIVGFHNEFIANAPFIIVGRKGSAGALHFSDISGYPIDTTFFIEDKNPEKLNIKYAFHILGTLNLDKVNVQAGIPGLNRNDAYALKIPLPPLSIQEEIVAEIEGYQKIIDGAQTVVANYKPKIDIDPEWEMVELGDAFNKVTKSVFPIALEVKEVNYLGLDNISQGNGHLIGGVKTNPKEIKSTKTLFKPKHILYGKLRPNLNKVYYSEIEGICSTDIFVLEAKDEIIPKFYSYHFLSEKFKTEVLKGIKGAQLPRVGYEYFSTLVIPKPPVQIQHQIVSQIEKEQELVNANKQLIEIFEQKIKDRIAKVWGEEKKEERRVAMAAEPQVEYVKG